MNIFKDWKTTAAGIVGALLVVAGILIPEKITPEDQVNINQAVSQILIGAGVLIEFITNLIAKDPVVTPPAE